MKRDELETRDRRQYSERRLRHSLRVLQVTRRVVRYANGKRSAFPGTGSGEELAYISDPRAHPCSPLLPFRIILEQVAVLFHDCSAAGGVDRDELRARALE